MAERVRPDLIVRGATCLVLGPADVVRQPTMPWHEHVHRFPHGSGLCVECDSLAYAALRLAHGPRADPLWRADHA